MVLSKVTGLGPSAACLTSFGETCFQILDNKEAQDDSKGDLSHTALTTSPPKGAGFAAVPLDVKEKDPCLNNAQSSFNSNKK